MIHCRTLFTLFECIVYIYRYSMASLHCSSMASLYFMAVLHCSSIYSIFQAEFFCDIFVFLLQILAEFFIITSEISRPDGIDKTNLVPRIFYVRRRPWGRGCDKTIYRKHFGNFLRCAGFNLTKEPVRRKSEPSTLYN